MKKAIGFLIKVLNRKKAVRKDGKIVFEDIEPQLPKTWKEFCEQNKTKEGEYFIGATCYTIGVNVDERNEILDRNILPSKQAAEQHLALMQLHQLRDCYRQGWKPNYKDGSLKASIVKRNNTPMIVICIQRSFFLSFPTRELAVKFLTNFEHLIKQAGDLI